MLPFLNQNNSGTPINLVFGLQPQVRSGQCSDLKFANGTFYDCELKGLVDSGASISVISKRFVTENALSKAVKPASHSATAAGQTTIEFKQSVSGPLVVGNKLIEVEFYVAPWLTQDCILGMDVLSEFRSIKLNEEGEDLILSLLPSALSEFSDVFDKDIKDACCDLPTFPIVETAGCTPHQAKVKKLSPRDEEFCKKQVDYLLAQGIIRKSRSN